MPYYKSKKGKEVHVAIGKNKKEVIITTEAQFYPHENLHYLFPDHIEKVETLEEIVRKEAIRQNPQPFKEVFLKDSLPTGSWKGERCFIIGGGASLKSFDFSKLEGEKIIAINKSFVDVPFADMVFAVDRQFQDWILKGAENMEQAQKLWPDFKGYKVWLKIPGEIYKNGIEFVDLAGHEGISTSLEEGIHDGANSGYAAINLAIALGANPIYLLGYDMKHDKDGDSHYHGGYPKKQNESQLQIYAKKFPRLAQLAKEKGIKIINLNKNSALDCFEFGTIEEALKPILSIKHNYVIVSFYTPEYVQDISRLIQSAERFKLPYDFELLKNLPLEGANKYKNWSKNAYLKATFIKKMMQKHQDKNIIWIDADAVIQKNPVLFDKIPDCDIAVHYRDDIELLTGTLYIRNNETMRNIVDQWIEANKTSRNFLEQKNLENVLDKNKEIKIFNFPASYCQIFDIMNNTSTPVIEHFQSSRKWRKNIDTMKKISIIMPTYNQDKFIEESINSILNQTFKNWELIIIDDGSTDDTKNILAKQNDPRIQIIHKENEGTGSALNMGFEIATGEYETWLASDNKYYPNALQDMFDILESKKDIDFVYCNCEIGVMDSTGLGEVTRKNYNSEVPMEWDAHKFYDHYNIGVVWLWRKELRISAGKDFILEPCEDYEMTTRMIEAGGQFYYHPIVSGWHRRHNENLTRKLVTTSQYIPNLHRRMIKKRDELALKKLPPSPEKVKKFITLEMNKSIEQHLQRLNAPKEPNISIDKWCLEKIPKRVYFYWGAERMPWLRYLTVHSFVKMNPDWEVILYQPISVTKTNTWKSTEHEYDIDCPDYSNELKNLNITIKKFDGRDIGIPNEYPEVWKSDFLRWHLLSKYGGFWMDMDIFFNKSMNCFNLNTLENKDLDTIVSISKIIAPASFHSIGFMGGAPNNDYFRYVMSKALRTKPDFTNYQSIGVVLLNSEFPTVESIRKKFPHLKVDTISFETVYAYYPMKLIEDIFKPNAPDRLKSHSIGIHWYAGHPDAGKFMNKVTHENYRDFANTPLGKLFVEVL